jgi:TRAP-type C4-dicarboxylate transport system permease small subunit
MSQTPSGARSRWRRFTGWYARALSWLLVASVAVLVVPVSLQIFSRYTELIPSYIWTEEMARFLFIWMIMIGAMIGIREGTHFEVDVWPRLGPRGAAALRIVSGVAVLGLALVFLWYGIEFTRFAWNRISELAELPLWLIHIAWPLAGATWLVFQGERTLDDARVLTSGRGA